MTEADSRNSTFQAEAEAPKLDHQDRPRTCCDSSRIDCLLIHGQQPGYILLSIPSTRDEADKAIAELAVQATRIELPPKLHRDSLTLSPISAQDDK